MTMEHFTFQCEYIAPIGRIDFVFPEITCIDIEYIVPELPSSIISRKSCLPIHVYPNSLEADASWENISPIVYDDPLESNASFELIGYTPPPLSQSVIACIPDDIGTGISEFFSPEFFTGESSDFELACFFEFQLDHYTGEVALWNLFTFPPIIMAFIENYAGEYSAELDLQNNVQFAPIGYSGENNYTVLSIFESFELFGYDFIITDPDINELWNEETVLIVGNIATFPEKYSCLLKYTFYPTIEQAVNAANNGTLIFIAPGEYNERIITNKQLLFRGLGDQVTDTLIYSLGRPYGSNVVIVVADGGHLFFENITIRCYASWEGTIQWQTNNTKVIFNKCFFNHGGLTHAIRGNNTNITNPPHIFKNCRITKGYNHFAFVNRSNLGLEKVEFDKAISYFNSTGTLPVDADYVITPTEGYGYNYGDFFVHSLCAMDNWYAGENIFIDDLDVPLGYLAFTGEESEFDLEVIYLIVIESDAYTGEYSDTDFSIYPFADLEGDAYTGENSSSELLVFTTLSSNAYSGETSDLDIISEVAFDIDIFTGEYSDTDLETVPPIEIISDAYTGEYSDTDLATTFSFVLIAYTGEYSDTDLEAVPPIEIISDAYTGEYSSSDLFIFITLSIETAYTGENVFSSLEAFYPDILPSIACAGSYGELELSTQKALYPIGYTGEFVDILLEDYPSIELEIVSYAGEILETEIQETITFPSNAYTGEILDFDIDYVVNLGMLMDTYSGEDSVFELATEDSLDSDAYSGEESETYFAPPITFEMDGYSGEYSDTDLSRFEPIVLGNAIGYSGEYSTITTLNFVTTFIARAYAGSYSSTVFSTPDIIEFISVAYAGSSSSITSLFFDFSIGSSMAYTGSYAIIEELDSLENFYFHQGQNCFSILRTVDNLPSIAHEGAYSSSVLFVGAPGVFDAYRGYAGETCFVFLDEPVIAGMSVLIRAGVWTQCDIDSATYFDLVSDDCNRCGPRNTGNNIRINMHRTEFLPEAVSFGNDVRLYVDLSCQIRFSGRIYTGEFTYFYNHYEQFQFTFYTGEFPTGTIYNDGFYRLCRGYFIPHGDYISTEINDILLDNCYADQFVSGETLFSSLSDSVVFRILPFQTGEHVRSDLNVDRWEFIFYTGENMYFLLSLEYRFQTRAYAGEVCTSSLFFPPIYFYTGEIVETTLVDDLAVRFLDRGCLDNQFRYQNSSGDELVFLYDPVPLEGGPYYRTISAECYIPGEEI